MSESSSESGQSGSGNSYVYSSSQSISRPPALTRDSTIWGTISTLPTPIDGLPFIPRVDASVKSQASSLASRRKGSTFSVQVRTTDLEDQRILATLEGSDDEGLDSYLPEVQTPVTPARRGSTKALINRYECLTVASMPTTPTTPRTPMKTPNNSIVSPSFDRRDSPLPPTPTPSRPLSQMKGRTPLRESFRNLMLLFGKKGRSKDVASPAASSHLSDPFLVNQSSPGMSPAIFSSAYQASPVIERNPPPLKTGPVLYLFRQKTEDILPVWSNCTASLLPDRILIEWSSAFGNPCQHHIRLAPSANVQSLTWSQVDHTERRLLPEADDDAHVFEIVFDSGVHEKFATESVADRSAWVSTTWDALLQLRTEESSNVGARSLLTTFASQSTDAMSLLSSRNSRTETKSESTQNDAYLRQPALTTSDTFGSRTLVSSVPQSMIGTSIRSGSTANGKSRRMMDVPSSISEQVLNIHSPASPSDCMKPISSRVSQYTSSGLTDEAGNYAAAADDYDSTAERIRYRLVDDSDTRSAPTSASSVAPGNVPERILSGPPSIISEVSSRASHHTSPDGSMNYASTIGESTAERTRYRLVDDSNTRSTSITTSSAALRNAPERISFGAQSVISSQRRFPQTTSAVPSSSGRAGLSVPALSRRDTVSSWYSHTSEEDPPDANPPTHLPTPPSVKRRSAYARSRSRGSSASRRYGSERGDGDGDSDTQSIVDLYSHGRRRFGPALSPVPDAGESQLSGTPDLNYDDDDEGASNLLSRHPTQRSEARSLSPERSQRKKEDVVVVLAPADTNGHEENPIVTLIQDYAVQQYTQTSEVSHQIASLQKDVLDMSKDLKEVLAEERGSDNDNNNDPALRAALEDLSVRLDQLGHEVAAGGDPARIDELHEKIDTMSARLLAEHAKTKFAMADIGGGGGAGARGNGDPEVKTMLADVDGQLKSNFPAILLAIEELPERIEVNVPAVNLDDIHSKLDDLLKMHSQAADAPIQVSADEQILPTDVTPGALPEPPESQTNSTVNVDSEEMQKKLDEIATYIRDDMERKKQQTEQQVDNVRYLNELNTWLEKFVDNGTSNILNVAQGVQRLCDDLLPEAGTSSENEDDAPADEAKARGIRTEIRSLLSHVESEGDKTSRIHEKLEELLELTKAASEKAVPSAASDVDMDTLVGLINRQREDHETLLRNIASELSNDIRGERVRFVEAMKEATAINVQVHVEEFKKELSKEVMTMTCEVGRLQRERQMLEQQIADLFAFFAKQRAEMERAQAHNRGAPPPPPSNAPRTHPMYMNAPAPQLPMRAQHPNQ